MEDDLPLETDDNDLSVDTEISSTETANDSIPIGETNDQCRGDDKFRCGKTSVFICEVQKCDGERNCPNGEDEVDCPSEGSEDIEGSADDESHAEEITTTETPVVLEEEGEPKEEIEEPVDEYSSESNEVDDDKPIIGDFLLLFQFIILNLMLEDLN